MGRGGHKLAQISSEPSCRIRVSLRCNLLLNRLGVVDGWSAQSHRSRMFGEMGHEEKVTWHCPSIVLEGRVVLWREMGTDAGGCMSQ